MSPRSGGEADKYGNRYEGAWTVRHLLYVLAGRADSITVEDSGEASQGAEFTYCRPGAVEVHQLKRQDGNASSWTVKSLDAKGIWTNVQLHAEAGRQFHFISTLPAAVLQDLSDRARRANSLDSFVKEWLTSRPLAEAFDDLCSPKIFGTAETAWQTLRKFWIDWPSERDLTEVNAALAGWQLEGSAGALAAVGLGDLVLNNLGVCLDASRIESELRKYGLKLAEVRRGKSISGQVTKITGDWAASVHRELLEPVIRRPETNQLVELTQGDDALLLLMGAAGGGKTAVLHQVVQALEVNCTPVLGFRLDRLDPFSTTTELGRKIGLVDVSPVTALATIAGDRNCVLIVDQVDAVSLVSGRMPDNFDAVANLVREASGFPNMRVLLACRKFDVENDYRIRELVDEKRCARVEVADLSDEQVRDAVAVMGLDASVLNVQQQTLLRSPLHLVLLNSIADDAAALNFQTTKQLFDAFWQRKLMNCTSRRSTVRFNKVVSTLAEAISERQRLSVPITVLDADDLAVDAGVLVSEHVLVRDGQQIAFFHESFFDYAFSRGWFHREQTLVEFLKGGEQELFRRAQVRQIMNHLRELDPDRFAADVEALLTSTEIRYHIVDVALVLLAALSAPTPREWEMVADVLATHPVFEDRLWLSLSGENWFARIDAEGFIEDWLSSSNEQAQLRALNIMTGAAKDNPERLAEILGRHAEAVSYPDWLRQIVRFVDLQNSRVLFQLVLDAVRAGQYEGVEHELWLSASDLGEHEPMWAVELLAAHLVDRADSFALTDSGKVSALVDRDYGAIELTKSAAIGAPRRFCELMIPYLLRVMSVTAREGQYELPAQDKHFSSRYPGSSTHELEDVILDAAASAIRILVEDDSEEARKYLEILAGDRHEAAQWLLYEGLRAAGEPFAQWAFDLILQGAHRFIGGYFSSALWAARQVIQVTSSFVSDQSFHEVESAILNFRAPWEKQNQSRYIFSLLSAMDEGRLSELGRRRLAELRRLYEQKQPSEPEGMKGGVIGSPIPQDAAERMSDDQWLGAMAKHNSDHTNWQNFTGGAYQLSQVLNEHTKRDPWRFAKLTLRISRSANPAYTDAILRGFGEGERLDDPTPIFQAVRHIVSLERPDSDRWLGWALRKYYKVVPADLVEIIRDRALNAVDPTESELKFRRQDREHAAGENLYMSGMNSARGSAVEALGDLLAYDADGSRTVLIAPALDRFASDVSDAVRACAAYLLHVAMRHARPEALRAFERLIEGDDSLLATRPVTNLIAYIGYEDPDTARPVIERMMVSGLFETRQMGGQLAAVGAMQWGMTDLFDVVLASADIALRKGAAGACAHLLHNTSDMKVASDGLKTFFNDSHEDVRIAASAVVLSLRGQCLRRFRDTLEALIVSDAFKPALSQLLFTLERAPDRVDDLVTKCVRHFIEIFGGDASDIRTGATGGARQVGELLIRAYAQAKSSSDRSTALDLLDGLLMIGAYGVSNIVIEAER